MHKQDSDTPLTGTDQSTTGSAEQKAAGGESRVRLHGPWWSHIEEGVCAVILATVLSVTAAGALFRYATDSPLQWTEPLARYLLIWLTMLGAAVLVKHHAHIQVTVVYEALPYRGRQLLDVLVAIVQLGIAAYLVVFGALLAADSAASTSVPYVDMSTVYAAVPLSGLLIGAYSLRDVVVVMGLRRTAA